MSNFDKYLLLTSLSFFFALLAVSLISLNKRTGPDTSYMYTPKLEASQMAPIDQGARKYQPILPKSVLHYSGEDTRGTPTVNCYLEQAYKDLIAGRIEENGAKLVASAQMNGDAIEIYTTAHDEFFVFVIGPDATGRTEACEVAHGTGWTEANAP